MSTQPQQPNPLNTAVNEIANNLLQQAVQQAAQHGPELAGKLITGLFNSIFHKKPKAVPVVAPPATPVFGTSTPIAVPVSVPAPGQVTRTVNLVLLNVEKAELPVMDGDRPHDPGNLIPDPMGRVRRGENFNWNTTFWLDLTAYDQNNDEWQGPSILAADKEYKTKHEIWKDGVLVARIEGLGGTGDQHPNAGYTLECDGVNVDQVRPRPWLDSIGCNVAVRLHAQGVYQIRGWFDGVEARGFDIHIS